MELYERNGEIGVLISPGFGAGWSTWNGRELAYDKRVIEFWLDHKDDQFFMNTIAHPNDSDAHLEAEAFFASIGYDRCPYLGGFSNMRLEFVPRGTPWRIVEYDGAERLETFEDAGFIVF